jgi:hypothetical protein
VVQAGDGFVASVSTQDHWWSWMQDTLIPAVFNPDASGTAGELGLGLELGFGRGLEARRGGVDRRGQGRKGRGGGARDRAARRRQQVLSASGGRGNVRGDVGPMPAMFDDYTALIGGIRLVQTRAAFSQDCNGLPPSLVALYGAQGCFPLPTRSLAADDTGVPGGGAYDASPYGNATAAEEAGVASAFNATAGDERLDGVGVTVTHGAAPPVFAFYLDTTAAPTVVSDQLTALRESGWIDSATIDVRVQLTAFNPEVSRLAWLTMDSAFTRGGRVNNRYMLVSVPVDPYSDPGKRSLLLATGAVVCIYTLYLAVGRGGKILALCCSENPLDDDGNPMAEAEAEGEATQGAVPGGRSHGASRSEGDPATDSISAADPAFGAVSKVLAAVSSASSASASALAPGASTVSGSLGSSRMVVSAVPFAMPITPAGANASAATATSVPLARAASASSSTFLALAASQTQAPSTQSSGAAVDGSSSTPAQPPAPLHLAPRFSFGAPSGSAEPFAPTSPVVLKYGQGAEYRSGHYNKEAWGELLKQEKKQEADASCLSALRSNRYCACCRRCSRVPWTAKLDHLFTYWRVMDIATVASLVATIAQWIAFNLRLRDTRQWIEDGHGTVSHAGDPVMQSLVAMSCDAFISFKMVAVITVILLSLRLFKYFRFQPRLAVLTETFARGVSDAIHFIILWLVILTAFWVWGFFMFGSQAEPWSAPTKAMLSVFRWANYEYDIEDLQQQFPGFADVFYVVFNMGITNLTMWMFLAIILENYDEVRLESHSQGPAIWVEAIAYFKSLPEQGLSAVGVSTLTIRRVWKKITRACGCCCDRMAARSNAASPRDEYRMFAAETDPARRRGACARTCCPARRPSDLEDGAETPLMPTSAWQSHAGRPRQSITDSEGGVSWSRQAQSLTWAEILDAVTKGSLSTFPRVSAEDLICMLNMHEAQAVRLITQAIALQVGAATVEALAAGVYDETAAEDAAAASAAAAAEDAAAAAAEAEAEEYERTMAHAEGDDGVGMSGDGANGDYRHHHHHGGDLKGLDAEAGTVAHSVDERDRDAVDGVDTREINMSMSRSGGAGASGGQYNAQPDLLPPWLTNKVSRYLSMQESKVAAAVASEQLGFSERGPLQALVQREKEQKRKRGRWRGGGGYRDRAPETNLFNSQPSLAGETEAEADHEDDDVIANPGEHDNEWDDFGYSSQHAPPTSLVRTFFAANAPARGGLRFRGQPRAPVQDADESDTSAAVATRSRSSRMRASATAAAASNRLMNGVQRRAAVARAPKVGYPLLSSSTNAGPVDDDVVARLLSNISALSEQLAAVQSQVNGSNSLTSSSIGVSCPVPEGANEEEDKPETR